MKAFSLCLLICSLRLIFHDESTSPFQSKCMQNLVGLQDVHNENLKESYLNAPMDGFIHDPCQWGGVQCLDGRIVKIHWPAAQTVVPKIHLNWMPSDVHSFHIDSHAVKSPLVTRHLPRSLDRLAIMQCGLSGTLDLGSLPKQLVFLKIAGNDCTGDVFLGNLPKNLAMLNISDNKIETVIGASGILPEGLEVVKLYSWQVKPRYNGIDKSPMDSRILLTKREL